MNELVFILFYFIVTILFAIYILYYRAYKSKVFLYDDALSDPFRAFGIMFCTLLWPLGIPIYIIMRIWWHHRNEKK